MTASSTAAVKKADTQERLRASTQPQDKKHCGADIRKEERKKEKCSSFEETYVPLC